MVWPAKSVTIASLSQNHRRFDDEPHEIGALNILSYFRRSKPPAARAPEADDLGQDLGQDLGDVAIGLETIGGEINGTYLDIASSPAPDKKARSKPPERPPRDRSPERQPERPPQFERQPAPQREQRPPGPRSRSEGNGAFPGGERRGVLGVHGVEKSFVGRMVVKGVSLYVRKGEAVGLLGPNGAGKTTVFYMATGLIKPDTGRLDLAGRDVTKLPMYQRARLGIGYLPQEASIFRGLNVEENIRSVLEVVEPDAKRRERDLDSLLEEFNIARLRKTPSIALSGGERRRCQIARALASRPNYMLLDEPLAGIDPIPVGDIQTMVRHLTNRGIGLLITHHNVSEPLGLTH